MENPLLAQWSNKFGMPPFLQIEDAHFEEAFNLSIACLLYTSPSPRDS